MEGTPRAQMVGRWEGERVLERAIVQVRAIDALAESGFESNSVVGPLTPTRAYISEREAFFKRPQHEAPAR